MKFAFDRLGTDNYKVYDVETLRTPKTNKQSLPRHEVHISAFSKEGQVCLKRVKGKITKRMPNITAESVVILLLDPRTKLTVESLIQPVFQEKSIKDTDENLALPLPAESSTVIADAVMEEGKVLLRSAHRRVFCAMHTSNSGANNSTDVEMPSNLDLVPSVEDDLVMYGATLVSWAMNSSPVSTIHE
ncbi:hypothetical protein GN958_ATG13626 [Phytophthora infestans]|uniref:Uncharacterized protein n=1 Tax=Phytophthora infestans TaxID=4787 RepID=A0A8S9UFK6_PHYIN|nr:hypothetical protein GN958_ATG13626 [Phytophthora infestans]